MTPAAIGAAALGLAPEAITHVEPIKHGLTNESWLVRAANDAVVVRLSNPATDSLRIDRASESVVLGVVAAAGIAPPVLLNDPDRHVLVTRYVGETWSLQDARVEGNVRRLAARLHQLHDLPVPAGVRTVELGDTVRGYLATLDVQGARSAFTSTQRRREALAATDELRASNIPCLCHNDVQHLNIVGRDEPLLIDWEYAGRGDPAFDLASVCVYHGYDSSLRELLLRAYATHGRVVESWRLERACQVFEYVTELWTAVRDMSETDR
jgi:thiamine kinase